MVKIPISTSLEELGEVGGGWWETDGYFRAVIDANGCLYSVVEQILTSFTLTKITAPRRNGVSNGNTLEMLLG